MRVVVDTNVWLVIIPAYSKYAFVYKQFISGKIKLLISNEILLEYEELMKQRYPAFSVDAELRELLRLNSVELILPSFNWNLITPDPDDNKFVDCAVAASADYIVTNDTHFSILKNIPFPQVNVLTLQQLIALLTNNQNQQPV
jgi:putative PIN family toxin of toxin-antitoxin system